MNDSFRELIVLVRIHPCIVLDHPLSLRYTNCQNPDFARIGWRRNGMTGTDQRRRRFIHSDTRIPANETGSTNNSMTLLNTGSASWPDVSRIR